MHVPDQQRARLGDVIEIDVEGGHAYAQFVNKERTHGALIRVLSGVFQARPVDIDTLIQQPERFYVFFPLTAALREGAVRRIGNYPIPAHARRFPTMRVPGLRTLSGKVESWWLWDGKSERKLPQLTDAERSLSSAYVVNDTMLKEKIESGCKPEDDS